MLHTVLDLLAFGVTIYDRHGRRDYTNAAAREHGVSDAHVARLIACAVDEPGVVFVALSGNSQLCAIAVANHVITIVARPADSCDASIAAALSGLTAKEQRIVSLFGAGNSAPDIARHLGISLHTIHAHLESVFAKTRTKSQNERIAIIRVDCDCSAIPRSRDVRLTTGD